jgi:maltose alpha-D-glucosyltransferase/alpha-amylase
VNLAIVRRAKERLERQILPRFFRAQPWFVDRHAAAATFAFGAIQEWSAASNRWMLATVAVSLAHGEVHRFAIPLAVAWEDEGGRVDALLQGTLAKVRRGARMGVLYDAFWDDRFWSALVSGIDQGETLPFGKGQLEFRATSAYPGFAGPTESATVTHTVSAQGQPWVNIDNRLWLKAYRWLLEGTHPELELSRFLTETAKFPRVPQLAGTVEYLGDPGTLHGEPGRRLDLYRELSKALSGHTPGYPRADAGCAAHRLPGVDANTRPAHCGIPPSPSPARWCGSLRQRADQRA